MNTSKRIEDCLEELLFGEHDDERKAIQEAKSLIMELISDAEQKTLERSIGLMKDILQENFHYRTMCGEVRDPGGLIDVMQEFVKYQELEPERKQFSEYLEELKAKL